MDWVRQLVLIWSMWVVQIDMDECFRLSVILINIVYIVQHVPYTEQK